MNHVGSLGSYPHHFINQAAVECPTSLNIAVSLDSLPTMQNVPKPLVGGGSAASASRVPEALFSGLSSQAHI